MVQGQVFLKAGGWNFSYLSFSRFIIFKFRNYFIFCKTVLYIALCYHNFMKKSHSKLSEDDRKNIPYKLRFISLFVKGFKRLEIDFWQKATVELVKSPFWYLFEPKEGWLVGLGQEGVAWGWGVCIKCLRGWNTKEQRRSKDFKKGEQTGSRGGWLKSGWGAGTLLQTMPSVFTLYFKFLRCLKIY